MVAATPAVLSRTVLVVDDEHVVRLVVSRFLKRVGWNVIEAESAEQALSMLDGIAAPDLVICDLTLPGISGAAFCRQVAERHPALAPRLVLTSGDAAAAAREVQRAALDCPVLGKPFSLADLERVVDSIARAG